jgi:hypothetical protein
MHTLSVSDGSPACLSKSYFFSITEGALIASLADSNTHQVKSLFIVNASGIVIKMVTTLALKPFGSIIRQPIRRHAAIA